MISDSEKEYVYKTIDALKKYNRFIFSNDHLILTAGGYYIYNKSIVVLFIKEGFVKTYLKTNNAGFDGDYIRSLQHDHYQMHE